MKRDSTWPRKYVPFIFRSLCYYCVARKQVQHNPHNVCIGTLMFRSVHINPKRWSPSHLSARWGSLDKPSFRALWHFTALQVPHGLVIAKLLCVLERQLVKQFERPLFVPALAAWLGLPAKGRLGRWFPQEMRGLWVDWSGHQHEPDPRLRSLLCFPLQSDENHVHTNVDMFENGPAVGLPSRLNWHSKFPWRTVKTLVSHCHVNKEKGSFIKLLTPPLWCDLL